jgi:hypothetical protein
MARVSLNCSCGWNFFIPGSTPGHEVSCPSCAQTVRIPGRKPGQNPAMSAGEIAAATQAQQRTIKLLVGVGILVVVVAGTIIAFSGRSTPPEENTISDRREDGLPGMKRGPATPNKIIKRDPLLDAPPPPPTVDKTVNTPAYSSTQVSELRREITVSCWLMNMTGIVSELMRYRNLTNEWAQFQAEMANHESKIKYTLGELARVGEKVSLEAYIAQGDQFIAFAGSDFTAMKSADAAQVIATWLHNWQAGPQLEQINVQRGDKKMTLYAQFPEGVNELLVLLRHPAIGLQGNPGESVGITYPIPADLIKNITGGFESLPKGYRAYLPPVDGKRLDQLLTMKRGSQEDLDWLKTKIVGEVLPGFQQEAAEFRSQVQTLEPKAFQDIASDVIYRKNGTKFEGKIVPQGNPAVVKIQGRGIAVAIPVEEIERIEQGKGSALQFKPKYEEAKGNLDKLVPLLEWTREKGLKTEKELVAYMILTLDASHEKARSAINRARPSLQGQVVTPPKYPVAEPAVKMQGVEKAVELIANEVVGKSQVFSDVVNEMRRRTEYMSTKTYPFAPEKAAKAVQLIGNPLSYRPNEMSVPHAMEIGTWWSSLTLEDRRQFARYFGLWCAYTRAPK